MALSENEQKLAKRLTGKIVFSNNDFGVDSQIIYDINEHGMVSSTGSNNYLYTTERDDSFYGSHYNQNILDELLPEFKPSFRFYKSKYIKNNYTLVLYTKDNLALTLSIPNKTLRFTKVNDEEPLNNDELATLPLDEDTLNLIERY